MKLENKIFFELTNSFVKIGKPRNPVFKVILLAFKVNMTSKSHFFLFCDLMGGLELDTLSL